MNRVIEHSFNKSIFLGFFFALLLTGCGEKIRSPVAMLSVSSDGRYVLSTHYGRFLILWDIQQRSKKILSKQASIFSPYFIPETHHFLWQDVKDNQVYVQSVDGKVLKSFNPGFPVYGHVMTTDLQHYVASEDSWSLYYLERNGKMKRIKENVRDLSGSARLFKLVLQGHSLLTSGMGGFEGRADSFPLNIGHTLKDVYPRTPARINGSLLDGVVLWDLDELKPIKKFMGNVSQTVATLSPDQKYVASGDENIFFYLWETKNGKRSSFMDPTPFKRTCYGKQCEEELLEEQRTNLVIPKDFYAHPWANISGTVAVRFIDEEGHLIRFIPAVNYGTLYHVSSPKVQAYMDFGKDPQPDAFSIFKSSNVIDTAPKAKILVMKQTMVELSDHKGGTGIIVYRFDPVSKTLKRLWAPEGPGQHKRIINPDDRWEY